jgi:hypothetical protein
MAKLPLVASGALMAGGAICLRLDRRESERHLLGGGSTGEAVRQRRDKESPK